MDLIDDKNETEVLTIVRSLGLVHVDTRVCVPFVGQTANSPIGRVRVSGNVERGHSTNCIG